MTGHRGIQKVHGKRGGTVVTAVAAATALLAAGCGSGSGIPSSTPADLELVSSLERFDSCDDLRSWAQEELVPRVGAYGFERSAPGSAHGERTVEIDIPEPDIEGAPPAGDVGDRASDDLAAPEGAAPGDGAGADAGAGDVDGSVAPEYSETNVQVQGIDEPDIVKTDGERILAAVDGRLHLVSAEGQEVVDTLDLPDGLEAADMMLSGDRVVLFGTAASVRAETGDGSGNDASVPSEFGDSVTAVAQVDIGESGLELTDRFEIEGSYVSARMIDDVLRLVVHADVGQRLPFVTPAVPTEEAVEQAERANRTVVEEADAEDLLPRWYRLDNSGGLSDDGVLLGCEQAHGPEVFAGFGMVAVATIDMGEGLGPGLVGANGAGVMAEAETVYASADHLYVAAPEWIDWGASAPGQEPVLRGERYGTDIHRFDISDPSRAVYDMSGWVDGELLNQFALDEHDGRLRVATTTGSPWGSGDDLSEGHVVVLEPADGALTEIGSVSGLGRGETIHSVRFMGDTGYVVTFQQVDPLYTIDLSDPAAPQEVGELKILGYSAYLHPVGEGWLLGVGQDGTEDGQLLGTQVSLFDVRDPADPVRVAQETLENADSVSEWDHRAFLWWEATGLAAVPISPHGLSIDREEELVGFTVDLDEETIVELGRVAHPYEEGLYDDGLYDDPVSDIAPVITPAILRSLVIDEELWTLSAAGLGANELTTLEPSGFVPFD